MLLNNLRQPSRTGLWALLLWAIALWAQADQTPQNVELAAGDYAFHLTHQGRVRDYLVHVPPAASLGRPMPMVLVLHGGMGHMQIQATERFYHQPSAADQYGYVAVFPNGYSRHANGHWATWNAGSCCGPAVNADSDDVGFIRAVIDDMQQRTAIDPQRVFVAGMSNGGMMAYRLACELSDKISAIASVAGPDQTLRCQPRQPVSVLHIHALDDDHVPYDGGRGPRSLAGMSFNSVAASVQKWRDILQATGPADTVLSAPDAHCDRYTGASADVQLCTTRTGGHAWPGGSKPRGGAAGATALSANATLWTFFAAHGRTDATR